MKTNKTNTGATVDYAQVGKEAVTFFFEVLKAEKAEKKAKKQTAQEAVQDGDVKRTNILGAFYDLLTKYDALGITALKSEYRACLEKATVDGKTGLFALAEELDKATDRIIQRAENNVRVCIENDVPTKVAMGHLTAVRCLKSPDGHSVGGALVRALLYIVEATAAKIHRFLGSKGEKGLWMALDKALKAFAGLIKLGIKITFKVVKGVACCLVASVTKLAQLFAHAFYMIVGVILVKSCKQDDPVDDAAEAAADELFEEFMDDVEGFQKATVEDFVVEDVVDAESYRIVNA